MDTTWLFWEMMRVSRDFDPWMYPALQKLKASKKYIMAALSNTVPFDTNHPYSNPSPEQDIRSVFDVFVSSAHVGYFIPFLSCPRSLLYVVACICRSLNNRVQGDVDVLTTKTD